MIDQEMLKLAAKAAGVEIDFHRFDPEWGYAIKGTSTFWNPLADDGDALRLAVRLCLSTMYGAHGVVQVSADDGGDVCTAFAMEPLGDDRCAATRRAIVRTAVEIGKAKQ